MKYWLRVSLSCLLKIQFLSFLCMIDTNFCLYFWDTSEVAFCNLLQHSFTFIFIECALQKMWKSRKIHLKNDTSGFCCCCCWSLFTLRWQNFGVLQLIHLSPDFINKMKCQEQARLAHRLMVVGKEHMKPFSTIQQTYAHNLIAQSRFRIPSQMLTLTPFWLFKFLCASLQCRDCCKGMLTHRGSDSLPLWAVPPHSRDSPLHKVAHLVTPSGLHYP